MPNLVNQHKFKFLTEQIKAMEWQVLNHQQSVDFRASVLIRKIYQQLTEPSSLLLAGSIGFIIGEITQRQSPKIHRTIDKAASPSPLKAALNLLTSVRSLYAALPLAWIMKSRYQPGAPSQAPQREFRSKPASGAS